MTKPKTPSSKEKTINDERVKVAVQVAQGNPSGTDIGYMPAVLCHVFFPYHDPGAGLDLWYRKSGNFILSVESTASINPLTMQPVKFGIPSGPKPRLILATLNNIALLQQKPELYLGHSLTEFIGQHLKLNTDGRTINEVKSQLARLSTAHIQIAYDEGHGHSYQDGMKVIRGLDVWWGKDKNQRHLWGNYLRFSSDYFNALQEHGVPLDMRALRAMSNNPVAIDLYSFLAHRLHNLKKPVSISWAAMKEQFGYTYKDMKDFKKRFRQSLVLVKNLYPAARFEEIENRGFILHHSQPPVLKSQFVVPRLDITPEPVPKAPMLFTPDGNPYKKATRSPAKTKRTGNAQTMKEVLEEIVTRKPDKKA